MIQSLNDDKKELFANMPVKQALYVMAVPTIISQLVNLIYNIVDAFFIGRTGNSYMVAATTITLTLYMMNVALANLFGIGGGSLVARLMGAEQTDKAKNVSSFCVYGTILITLIYSFLVWFYMEPLLRFLGASNETIGYASVYTFYVIVIGSLPCVLALSLSHLLRNVGFASQASYGLSGGGILNVVLDPVFMFYIMPKGQEVTGAAFATLISNVISCLYLSYFYYKATKTASLSMNLSKAFKIDLVNIKSVFSVGIPSAALPGLFDLANICVGILSAAHNDLVLAGMGIVMKVERIPNAINIGISQGMLPIVAYNYSSGNHERMKNVINAARKMGLHVSLYCILFFIFLARHICGVFMNTTASESEMALTTIAYATLFLRIRCLAAPVQFMNFHTSFCMQAMGEGGKTLLHAIVREIVFYIPFMFILDKYFGEKGLAAALPVGEACGAAFALWLLHLTISKLVKA